MNQAGVETSLIRYTNESERRGGFPRPIGRAPAFKRRYRYV